MVDQFSLDLNTAGDIGALFGFMNIFTRASGGMISDIAARYYGMRGRCVGARGAGWWPLCMPAFVADWQEGLHAPSLTGAPATLRRIWALWIIQTLGGVFCVLMGKADGSLTLTIVHMIIFSVFCQVCACCRSGCRVAAECDHPRTGTSGPAGRSMKCRCRAPC
jgi:NNP family nitrate/nitrite transporter-like MFS transporter